MSDTADVRETAVNYCAGDKTITLFTAENKYINKINKLKEKYPDDVNIKVQNEDGSIVVNLPIKWFKFPSPPKKVSEETAQKAAERFRNYHANKNAKH